MDYLLAFTITISPYDIAAVLGLFGSIGFISLGVFVAKKIKARKFRIAEQRQQEEVKEAKKQQEEAEQLERDHDEQAKRDRVESVKFFPQPWLDMWDEHKKLDSHHSRGILLKAQLSRYHKILPRISIDAINKFAEMVAWHDSDKDFVRAAESLSPYLALKNSEFGKASLQKCVVCPVHHYDTNKDGICPICDYQKRQLDNDRVAKQEKRTAYCSIHSPDGVTNRKCPSCEYNAARIERMDKANLGEA